MYGLSFNYDSSSLDYSSCWYRFKTTFLSRDIFFSFVVNFWSIIYLKFDGIWSSYVGSLDITCWLNKQEKFLSYSIRFSISYFPQ